MLDTLSIAPSANLANLGNRIRHEPARPAGRRYRPRNYRGRAQSARPREEGGINVPGTIEQAARSVCQHQACPQRTRASQGTAEPRLPDRPREHRGLLFGPEHVPRERQFMPTEDAALSVHVLRLRSGDRSRAGNAGCARDGQPTEHDRLIAAAAAAARRVRSADPRSVFDGERGRRDPAEQQTARAHEPGIRRATPEAGFIARATLRSPELAQSRRTGGGSEHGEGET
jgi:hypothetical protein